MFGIEAPKQLRSEARIAGLTANNVVDAGLESLHFFGSVRAGAVRRFSVEQNFAGFGAAFPWGAGEAQPDLI